MSKQQDLREQTNPIFHTAMGTLRALVLNQNPDGLELARQFGLDQIGLEMMEGRQFLGTFIVENRYFTMNNVLKERKEKILVDLPCGYTPRGLHEELRDKTYIGLDLPAVIDELTPLITPLLEKRDLENRVYQGVDATNYQSLKNALENIEEEIVITTEGLVSYLSEPELDLFVEAISRLLKEHGGVWLTFDPETNLYFSKIMPLVASKGVEGSLDQSKSNLSKSHIWVFDNELSLDQNGSQESLDKALAYLARFGLKAERIPIANYMPYLQSLEDLSGQTREAFEKAMEQVCFWIISLEDQKEEKSKIEMTHFNGENFSLELKRKGSQLEIILQGRVDSITAPLFLEAYEKAAREQMPQSIEIEAKDLDYIT